jgi:beta-galactosidase
MNQLLSDLSEHRKKGNHAYWKRNDSRILRKWNNAGTWFFGAVYWWPAAYKKQQLVDEFCRMRDTGFNLIRFHNAFPEETAEGSFDWTRTRDWFEAAAEADMKVFMCLRDHDHPIPTGLLKKHGLTPEELATVYADDLRYQALIDEYFSPLVEHTREYPHLLAYGGFGEPGAGQDMLVTEEDRRRFTAWLEAKYGSIEALNEAWNIYPGHHAFASDSFEHTLRFLDKIHIRKGQVSGVHRSQIHYAACRDLTRFLTEKELKKTEIGIAQVREMAPEVPLIIGSHNYLTNQTGWRWDHADYARLSDGHFCSLHLSWNHDLVHGEVDRPVYLQSRMTRDYHKGGITSAFETTGGPVQYSGGYGNAMSPGLMRRLVLTYLATGHTNVAFWSWNCRPGFWEAGEYGLTSLSGEITSWCTEAGKIAKAMVPYVEELRRADHEPAVAILESWDTDAILSLEPSRVELETDVNHPMAKGSAHQAVRARMGIARVLLNHHIPFEILPESECREAPALLYRYPVIYVPHARALSEDVLDRLEQYVREGGTLIADVQFAFMDPWGKLRPTGTGGRMETLFGAWPDTIHDTRTTSLQVEGIDVEGFYGDLKVTKAHVLHSYNDGTPAVTEHQLGKGRTLLIGFDAARMCQKPIQPEMERFLANLCRISKPEWESNAPLAHRLVGEQADHYFLFNDGGTLKEFTVEFPTLPTRVQQVIEHQESKPNKRLRLQIDAQSAVWIRCEKKNPE